MHWNIFEEGSNHTLEIQDNTIKTKEEQSSNMGNSDGSNTYQFNLKHRQRLLESFLNNPEGMQKYQILELLLTFVIPQKDLRPVAKKLLKKFGSLHAILHAHQDSLVNIGGIGTKTVGFLKCIAKITNLLLQEEITISKELPMSVEKIAKYAIFSIGHLNYEKVMVFIFDSKKTFIKEYFHSKGTLSYSPMYIRELLVEVLNTRAAFIIMVHNHPSGNTYPSSADIEITKKITNLFNETDICLYDHLIVSSSSHTSMKRLGLF